MATLPVGMRQRTRALGGSEASLGAHCRRADAGGHGGGHGDRRAHPACHGAGADMATLPCPCYEADMDSAM